MLTVLDRSTFFETMQLLVIGLALVAGVFFGTAEFAKVLTLICDLGFDATSAILVTVLQLPNTAVFTMPAGVLLATGVVLWRRVFDYELLSLSICGASYLRILTPFLVMGFVASGISYYLSDSVVPQSRKLSNQLFYIGAINSALPRSEKCLTFFQYNENQRLKHILMVGRTLDRSLENVVIFDMAESQSPKVIWAKSGTWYRGSWHLKEGHIYEIVDKKARSVNMRFQKLAIDVIGRLTAGYSNRGVLPTEMTTAELAKEMNTLKASRKPVPPPMMLRYLRRFSQPASCFLLVLAALPLTVASPRRRGVWGLGYIGVLVVVYFIAQQLCLALGDWGQIDAYLAAWFPGVLALTIGMLSFLFVRLRN